MTRKRLNDGGGLYFRDSSVEFFSSGCVLVDCVLGGGWAVGRIANLVGDSSTGKTLLAIEACANFHRKYPTGKIFYIETEGAFDENYAASVGLPSEHTVFPQDVYTIEDFAKIVEKICNEASDSLIVLDSLDALSDAAELGRTVGQATMGVSKPKLLSEFFRRLTKKELNKKNNTLLVVSQIRDNVGVSFGDPYVVNGGRALKFYCSQRLWLTQKSTIERTKNGIKRVIGVKVKAKAKKNKIGMPHRECEFPLLFSYGIDDVTAACEWLMTVKKTDLIPEFATLQARIPKMSTREFIQTRELLSETVAKAWHTVEVDFAPPRSKYADPTDEE